MSRRAERAELRRRLDALAARPVVDPDPISLDVTEARLRSIYDLHRGRIPEAHDTTTGGAPRAARRRATLGSLVIASAALTALGVITVSRDDGAIDVELTAASGAYIVLPDGRRIDATAGVTVPEGGRLVVRAGGSVTVGGIILGPGATAIVVDGELEIEAPGNGQGNTTGTTGSPGPESTPPPTGSDPSGQVTNPPTTARPPTSTAPTTTTTAAPTTTAPPTTSPPREIVRLTGGARVVDGVVRVRWDPYSGSDFGGYVVLARLDGERPRPGQDGTIVVLRTRDRLHGTARTDFTPGMSIRVVALDTKGQVVGSTIVFQPGREPRVDPPPTTAPPTSAPLTTTSTTTPPPTTT